MVDRIDQLTRLLAAEPGDVFCLYSLAQEFAKRGDHAQALAHYDKAIAADPNYCYAYFHKARTQETAGDLEGAAQTLRLGLRQARISGDSHALSEIESYLDSIA